MMKIFILVLLGTVTGMSLCYAMGHRRQVAHADTPAVTTTSMNGNTSTNAGVAISSTASSATSRNASGN